MTQREHAEKYFISRPEGAKAFFLHWAAHFRRAASKLGPHRRQNLLCARYWLEQARNP